MSQVEEDPELRDLVTEALEKTGVLAAVRAHLRAGVFLALEREHEQKCGHHAHLQQLFSSRDGCLALLLVHELLEFCQLRHTASVYSAETGQPHTYVYKGRDALIYDLKLTEINEKSHLPVLVQLISILFKLSKNNISASQTSIATPNESYIDPNDKTKIPKENLAISPDNYDTTFTFDSTNNSIRDNKSKENSQIDQNISEEIEKSLSDHVEDDKSSVISEQSYNTDARIELHTDSDKSLPDATNNSNLKLKDRLISNRSNSAVEDTYLTKKSDPSGESLIEESFHYGSTSELASTKHSIIDSKISKQSEEFISESVQDNFESSIKKDSENHTHDDASQYSNKTDLSNESISEEILHYEDDDNSNSDGSKKSDSRTFDNYSLKSFNVSDKINDISTNSISNNKNKLQSSDLNTNKTNIDSHTHNNGNKSLKKNIEKSMSTPDKISRSKILPPYNSKLNIQNEFSHVKSDKTTDINGSK